MSRLIRLAPLSLVALLAGSAHAQGLPNLDRALAAPAVARTVAASPNGAVASSDSRRAVPTFFWADPSRSLASSLGTAAPADQALAYVRQNAALYGLPAAALKAAYVREIHDTGRGGIVVVLGQRVGGVEVFETEMKVLLDRQGHLVAIGGNLHGSATPKSKGGKLAFNLGDAAAVAIAASDASQKPLKAADLTKLAKEKADYHYFDLGAGPAAGKLAFANPARAKKVFFAMPDRLVPAYYLEVDLAHAKGASANLHGYVIAASNGEILMRRNLVHDVAYKYRVWADAAAPFTPTSGPQADYAPHPTGLPDGSIPAFIAPSLITMEGFNTSPNGGPDPWLGPSASDTTGNNVEAYADLVAPDGFTPGGDVHATPTAPLEFDRVYDTSLAPAASQNQIMASATQLFYVTNWLHDYYYDSGFNEAAGNAQASNFGRGGVEGDSMRAEAQDVDGIDNADMATPADGERPRMQMYLWDGVASSSLLIQPSNLSPNHQVAGFGAPVYNVTATLILADDGNGNKADACQAIVNNVAGKIALIDRGTCTFEAKVLRAQQAGAIGVLIANNNGNGLPAMTDDPATNGVTIGSLGISQATGNTLKTALTAGTTLTVTMASDSGAMRDGSIDNDTVAHEWGHYLHHRLVSCGASQCDGESEGWGDFNAMLMKVREGDNVTSGTFALSAYVTAAFGDGGYFGIRRFPYTRDKSKNGLTFKHVNNDEALPDGPQQPVPVENWEPHNVGEVWAMMLFQAYSSLISDGGHPFAEAKRRMADYVVAGMKMAPVNPTITEQRDGLLAAAAASDLNDFALLAKGFADRGAGTCAISPPRDSTTGNGVVEDFAVSGLPMLASVKLDDSVQSCDSDGILDGGETGKLHVEIRNTGTAVLNGTSATVSSSTAGVSFPNGATVSFPAIAPFQTAIADVDVALDGSFNAIVKAKFNVTLANPSSCNPSVKDSATIRVHLDDTPNDSTIETVDSENAPWVKWGATGFEDLAAEVWSRDEQANGNFRFYGQNFGSPSDTALVSPDLVVGSSALVITFKHAHDFESEPQNPGDPDTRWDGGLIEISSDGGATWKDVSNFGNPGYNGVIANVDGADNPLADRPAYVARNAAWPSSNDVSLNLGNAFANQTVKIRFRIGTDAAVGVPDFQGWFIDDINVQGITNKPFRTVKVDMANCNLSPLADAGPDQVVDEGTGVVLDASKSSDPESDPLNFSWAQTAGPSVIMMATDGPSPTFVAPQVAADTQLTFEVTVSDGAHSAKDSVNVVVNDLTGSGGAGGSGGIANGGASNGGSADGGNGGSGGESTSNGGNGYGGKDLVVTACTCRAAGDEGSSPSRTAALLAPLLGGLALMMRRRRRGQ